MNELFCFTFNFQNILDIINSVVIHILEFELLKKCNRNKIILTFLMDRIALKISNYYIRCCILWRWSVTSRPWTEHFHWWISQPFTTKFACVNLTYMKWFVKDGKFSKNLLKYVSKQNLHLKKFLISSFFKIIWSFVLYVKALTSLTKSYKCQVFCMTYHQWRWKFEWIQFKKYLGRLVVNSSRLPFRLLFKSGQAAPSVQFKRS